MSKNTNKSPHKKNKLPPAGTGKARSAARGRKKRKAQFRNIGSPEAVAKANANDWFYKYFPLAKSPKRSDRAKVARDLETFRKGCPDYMIPDSGADISMLGSAFEISPAEPRTEMHVSGIGGNGETMSVSKGRTVLLDPAGKAIAILKIFNGVIRKEEEIESILSEAQARAHGCSITDHGTLRTISHDSWHMPIHCLFRNNGWFLPIRKPTKVELDSGLPELVLTGRDSRPEVSFEDMLEKQFTDHSAMERDSRSEVDLPKVSVRSVSTGKTLKSTKAGRAPVPKGPLTGPRKDGPEALTVALAGWAQIMGIEGENWEKVRANLRATTQEAVDLECETRQIPVISHKRRFPYLRPRYLGEKVFTDTIEWKDKGKKHFAQTFYAEDSMIMEVYEIGSTKNAHEAYEQFITDWGAPSAFVSDGHKAQNLSKKVKKLGAKYKILLALTEAHKPNQNKSERANRVFKAQGNMFMQKYNIPTRMTIHIFKWVAYLSNHSAKAALRNRTPMEAFSGETPDVSHLRYHIWERVWYKATNASYPNLTMLPGRYLGPAQNTGDQATHIIMPEATKGTPSPTILSRSVVTPRHEAETAFGQVLTDRRKSFLFHPYLSTPRSKRDEVPWNVQKLQAEPKTDESATKRRKPERDASPNQGAAKEDNPRAKTDQGRPTSSTPEPQGLSPVETLRQQAKEFSEELTSNELSMNPDDSMENTIIGHDAKTGTFHTRNGYTGQVTKKVLFDELRVDTPRALATYVIKHGMGQKRKTDVWLWATKYINVSNLALRRIRAYCTASTEENTMGPTHEIRRTSVTGKPTRTKGKKRKFQPADPTSRVRKYGLEIPKNAEDAYRLDLANGNTRWGDAIKKEITAIMKMGTLKFPGTEAEKDQLASEIKNNHHQFAKMWFIFDVKMGGIPKARLVIGGHMTDPGDKDTFSSQMRQESSRILLVVSDHMDYDVAVGDVNTAYLYAMTSEMIYTEADIAFVKEDYVKEIGEIARVVKAQYGLKTSGHEWWLVLSDTLADLGFKRSKGDPDVWYRPFGDNYYDYIGTHTDDLLVVSKRCQTIFKELEAFYTFKDTVEPVFHLGVDYVRKTVGEKVRYEMGSFTYVKGAIERITALIEESGHEVPVKSSAPLEENYQPELDESTPLEGPDHTLYMQLVGTYLWIVALGRVDIAFAVSSMSRFSAIPREGHLEHLFGVFAYLSNFPDRRIPVDARPMDESIGRKMKGARESMLKMYPDAFEEIDDSHPEPRGEDLETSIWFDANNAHDQLSRRSISGIIAFLGRTMIKGYSRRQTSIASSTYTSELHAGRTASEEAMSLRYLLRSLGIRISRPTILLGDNEGSLKNTCEANSALKKRHVGISYHVSRECQAAGITERRHVSSQENRADMCTKALSSSSILAQCQNGIFCNMPQGNKKQRRMAARRRASQTCNL